MSNVVFIGYVSLLVIVLVITVVMIGLEQEKLEVRYGLIFGVSGLAILICSLLWIFGRKSQDTHHQSNENTAPLIDHR